MSGKKQILIIFPTIPFPQKAHGIATRYLPVIERFHEIYNLDLLIIDPMRGPDFEERLAGVKAYCDNVWVAGSDKQSAMGPLYKFKILFRSMVIDRAPHKFVRYDLPENLEHIKKILKKAEYSLIIWVSSSNSVLLPLLKESLPKEKLVLDLVDSVYLHVLRRGGKEAVECGRWEGKIAGYAREIVYISQQDLDAVKPFITADVKTAAIPNGTHINQYIDAKIQLGTPSIGFLGAMSYMPNVDACVRLHGLYKRLRERIPGLKLVLIGRDPVEEIQRMHDGKDVFVTGTVDSIWEYINGVDLFVLPLFRGAGLQNKVLEIMYAGKPIVMTSIANGGVGAIDGEHALIADDAASIEERVCDYFSDTRKFQTLGGAAKALVEREFMWDGVVEQFVQLVERNTAA